MRIAKMLARAGGLCLGTGAHADITNVTGDCSALPAAIVKDSTNHDSVLDVNSFTERACRRSQACGSSGSEKCFERS